MAPAAESPAESTSSKRSEDTKKDRSSVAQQQEHTSSESAAVQDQPDQDDTNGDSSRRSQKSPRKSNKKSKKRHVKPKASLAEHELIIRDHIDTLKERLREHQDDATLSETIDTLEGLSTKLKNAPLPEPKHDIKSNGLSSRETVTMLHFFYIVRLAQQGFFSVISSSFPAVEIDSIVYLCDKLVGSSLFAVKDASDEVRKTKHDDVFDLLRKLHSGVDEAVGEGYSTTFRQMKDMIRTLVENSLSQAQSNTSSSSWPLAPTNAPPPTTQHCAPPVFLVVPFNSMIDMSALSLYQSNDIKVAAPSVPDTPSEPAPVATEETTAPSSPQAQESDQQSQHGSEVNMTDKDDDNQSRSSARGRGGRGRGYGRTRGRGRGGEGGGRGYRGNYRGRSGEGDGGLYRGNSNNRAWSPRGG